MSRRHGTRRTYQKGCDCTRCVDAERTYQRNYREGQPSPLIDASETGEHVRTLLSSGWTTSGIAARTGYSYTGIRAIARKRYGRIHRETAADLLSVQPKQPMEAAS